LTPQRNYARSIVSSQRTWLSIIERIRRNGSGQPRVQMGKVMAPDKGLTVPHSQSSAPPEYTVGQLWQVPLFLAGLAVLSAVWLTRPLWYDAEVVHVRRDLAAARSQLQDAHVALNGLTVLLSDALNHIDRVPDRAGEAHFLLGSTYLRLAEQVATERAADFWQKARTHLEQGEQLGVPESDGPPLLYRLGQAWYHTGGDAQRIIDHLNRAIDQVEDDRAIGYEILTQCYLRLPAPNLAAALQAVEKQLQLPTVNESRLIPARLLRGELLLHLQQHEAARKVLAQIGTEAPPAIQARARYLRACSYQDEKDWVEAAKLWQEVLADRRQPPTDPGRVWYSLGCCYRNLHRAADADRAWDQAVQQGGVEAQAARLRLANVRVETDKIPSALELYERALSNVREPASYQNPLVTLPEAGALLAADCRTCKDAGKFEAAEKLARLYTKLAPPGPAQVLVGQVTQAWAAAQYARARQGKDLALVRQEGDAARRHFREAAAAYQAAAEASADQAERTECLWQAASCWMQGQDFQHAVAAYEVVINLRPAPARLSEAWYGRGEAHQALHQDDSAAKAYLKCIETGGLFASRARYRLAMVENAHGNFAEAENMLKHSLDLLAAEPEPDREAQENTLFAYADLLFLQRRFSEAAKPYDQALTLYPASVRALTGLYRLALCYRNHAAHESEDTPPGDLQNFRQQRNQFAFWLDKAAEKLQRLVDDLQARQTRQTALSQAEPTLFRQARFDLADCRFRLGQYEPAIRLYIGLANEYDQQVEGVLARKQLCRCYLATITSKNQEEYLKLAMHTLQEMRQTLNHLDASAFQGRPDTESKAELEAWLKSQEEELKALGALPRSRN
jgi:tetratricopeptide (TPR) repeat protein